MSALAILAPIAASLFRKFLLPKLILKIEKEVGAGQGPTVKKPLAMDVATPIVEAFAKIGVGLPQGEELGGVIDEIVAAFNKDGVLKGAETELDPTPRDPELFAMGVKLIQRSQVLEAK